MFKLGDKIHVKAGYPDFDRVFEMHIIDQYTLDDANILIEDIVNDGVDYVVKINGQHQLHD